MPADALSSNGPPAAVWQLRTRRLSLDRRPRLMGIVNVTPDSFSDGGRFFDASAAVDHALQLVADGADLIDVGGESTRPGSRPVDATEELRRVLPVVQRIVAHSPVAVSIDTRKALVAREALAAGAELINDVTALTFDPAMLEIVRQSGCGVCIMHMQGTPESMQQAPHYADVVTEVLDYLAARRDALTAAGIQRERIAADPGLGFGKTTGHNLALLAAAGRLHGLGLPLLVGPSRKRFIGDVLGDPQADRTAGTIGVCLALARQGVQVLRVHDVRAVHQALQLYDTIEAASDRGPPV